MGQARSIRYGGDPSAVDRGCASAPEARAPTMDIPAEEGPPGGVRLRVEPPPMLGGFPAPEVVVPLSPGGAVVMGSSSRADVRIPDPYVSALHCRVAHAGDALEVVDLGSRNGVHIGASRVGQAALGVGASFTLGRSVVHVDPASADEPAAGEPLRGLVGSSPSMRRLASAVRSAAPLRMPALVRGETGTGKELVARALHDEGTRARGPFVAINAAAVTRELAESELFGHVRGAFTGAMRDRRGAFREAHGGTLFLDEVAALPLEVQAKLLRAVEEGLVRPLGAEAPVSVDVRLVAATCEPLERMVTERAFRADLYERLAVCIVRVPPLRERPDDVAPLAEHLLAAADLGGRELTRGATSVLREQPWPGNVRELRNVVVQAALRAGPRIRADHVVAVLSERAGPCRRRVAPGEALRIFEEVGYNVSAAARRAELPRTSMRDLLRSAGVPPRRSRRRE